MKKILFLSGFVLLSIQQLSAGGPWPQAKGKAYLKLSEWWTVFDQHYTDRGIIDPNTTMGLFNTTFYGEYGLGNGFTAILNAPLFSRSYSNNLISRTTDEILAPGESLNSIGDIDVSFKYSFQLGSVPLSTTLLLGIPSGNERGGSLGNLQTGDGEFNQLVRVDGGISRNGSVSWYSSAYLGFNNRTNDFSDEFRSGLEVGVGLLERKLWVTGRLDVVESLKNGATAETITSSSVFANNTEFVGIGIETNVYLTDKLGVSAGIAGAIRGEIIAASPSYTVGVFLDLGK